ncbi:TIGR04255 family protein [Leptolyngbya sp. CCY15150]|uniref:TIGR04255 family protein n=1 Tax=Leptolyngbya sp. CCY15150 TaxID=2767772 RepID=UPI0019509BE1
MICQLRFPKILRIDTEVPVAFQEAIRAEYPTLNTSHAIELPFLSNPQTNSPPIVMGQGLTYEFFDKEGKWKLVLSSDFIALSTVDYEKWEDFRSRLSSAISLLVKYYSPSHFTRVGLRYQDLIIRSELGLEQHPWRRLLQPPVLGVFVADNLPEHDFTEALSVFACRLDYADAVLRVRYGLAREDESDELGYLIDADFYTENNTEINDVTHSLDQFNREAGNFFRWCITEELQQALQPKPLT